MTVNVPVWDGAAALGEGERVAARWRIADGRRDLPGTVRADRRGPARRVENAFRPIRQRDVNGATVCPARAREGKLRPHRPGVRRKRHRRTARRRRRGRGACHVKIGELEIAGLLIPEEHLVTARRSHRKESRRNLRRYRRWQLQRDYRGRCRRLPTQPGCGRLASSSHPRRSPLCRQRPRRESPLPCCRPRPAVLLLAWLVWRSATRRAPPGRESPRRAAGTAALPTCATAARAAGPAISDSGIATPAITTAQANRNFGRQVFSHLSTKS